MEYIDTVKKNKHLNNIDFSSLHRITLDLFNLLSAFYSFAHIVPIHIWLDYN